MNDKTVIYTREHHRCLSESPLGFKCEGHQGHYSVPACPHFCTSVGTNWTWYDLLGDANQTSTPKNNNIRIELSPSGEQSGVELRKRIAELEAERLRFYHADGSYETLASPEAVIARRIECAQQLQSSPMEELRNAARLLRCVVTAISLDELITDAQELAALHDATARVEKALAASPSPAPTEITFAPTQMYTCKANADCLHDAAQWAACSACNPSPAPTEERMYYILTTSHKSIWPGGVILFWAANRSGYSTFLEKAGRYTEEEARSICKPRDRNCKPVDFMVPCELAESHAVRVVDIDRSVRLLAGKES